jgi:hypothetical protein
MNKFDKHEFATVGHLLDFIEKHNISRDAKIYIERVKDKYFEGIDISGIRGQLPDGSYGILPEGTKSTPWPVLKKGEDTEYHIIWSPCYYPDDNNLFLDAHY